MSTQTGAFACCAMHHAILGQSRIARKRGVSLPLVFPIGSLIYRSRARFSGLSFSCNWKCCAAQEEVCQSLEKGDEADAPPDPAIHALAPRRDSRAKMRHQDAPSPDVPDPP
ncbi:hypothetical protein ACQUJT_09750 [Ralstonia pseudosolanacearum]